MKRLVCLICGCWLLASAMAQTSRLSISTDKTTSLIFPFSIRHVDRGTRDVLAQQVREADNILLVKASAKNFAETNLSVVTDDGSVYSFVINYEERPATLVYNLPAKNKKTTSTTYAKSILDNPRTMRGVRDKSGDIEAEVIGIYIIDDLIYCQIRLRNNSSIDYDIDVLRFYIRDKKNGKRTAVQENELLPLNITGNVSQVKAFRPSAIVTVLNKFTIPDKKFMGIQIMEKNGGRHLNLKVNNHDILNAISLPELQ